MKKLSFFVLLGVLITAACVVYVPYPKEGPPPEEEEYYEREYGRYPSRLDTSYFYDYLSDYGIWVYYPPHGYVWIPQITRYGWHPYTYGYWVWTDYGWTWVSRFEWGWAPFHYGRWGWDAELGWFWVPDTVWGPAWVTWRRGSLFIGWAPLPPEVRFVVNVGITSLPFSLPHTFWVFVDGRYFLDPYVYRYVLPFERNTTIINFTVIHTNIVVRDRRVINRGIDIDDISRITKKSVTPYELRDVRRPQSPRVTAKKLEIFRPALSESQTAKPKNVLEKNVAAERISRTSVWEKEEEVSLSERERRLTEVHKREVRLLEESQKKEVSELKGKREEEKDDAQSSSEKQKIEKKYIEKADELKESHEKEKSRIEKRHEEEKERVTKKKIKKKK